MWKKKQLGEVAEYVNGRAFKPKEWKKSGLPIIRIQNLNDETAPYNYSDEKHKDKYLVKNGDLLFAWSASLGAYIWKGGDAWLNQHIFRVDHDESINKKYLYYCLTNVVEELYAKTHGSGMVHVTKGKFEETEVPVPSIEEQNRIVEKIEELFSELDNGVENLKKAQKQLKIYRQAVLKDAFEGKLTKEWREQQDDLPTPEELLQQIKAERKAHRQRELTEWEKEVEQWEKDGEPGRKPRKPSKPKNLPQITKDDLSSLPEIPSTWRYTYLYDLGDLGRGKSKHRPRNDDKLFKDGTIPFIQTGEVKAATKYLRTFEDTYNEFGLSQSKLWPKGTLCITIAANIAETAILDINACFPDSIVGYTSYASITDKLFVFYFIQSVQKRLEAFAPATAQKNINLTTLENLLVPLCSLKEQKEIVNEIESRLSVVDQLEQTIKENLQKAEALRQSILKKAFGGELVKEEPAKILEFQQSPQRYYKNKPTDLHAGLMCKIIDAHYKNEKHLQKLNHVKCEKIIHMLESHEGIELERKPVKDAAGPDDFPKLKKIEHRAKFKNWFEKDKSLGGKFGYGYKPKKSLGYAISDLEKIEGLPLEAIDKMIGLFLKMDKERAEIVATLYAAWNNFLIDGHQPSDEEIVRAAREDWSKQKLNIKRHRFFKALPWMRKNGLIPAGKGKRVLSRNSK
ncbi:MAG: type I restriction endonuclease subunit S [Balneolaceae bacterium]|nr:type I restriction endonuclease subunit S [Balneolaceae bacterium]